MGGSEMVINRASIDYSKGKYRWVAEVMDKVVQAEPDNVYAKYLLADALEQLGY
jgi:alkyl sulfatase BDS1-like metallo-beta-lactamase superfamily hydrolase